MAQERIPYGFKALFETMAQGKALYESQDEIDNLMLGATESCSIIGDDISESDIDDDAYSSDDYDDITSDIVPDELSALDKALDDTIDRENSNDEKLLASLEEALDLSI